jgi:peptidyl-prolyl cis-trans isomerase C
MLEGRPAGEVSFAGSEAEDEVIERLLAAELPARVPDEAECRRYYEADPRRFATGELVEARHILFAMTPRVPPERLRAKAAEVHALASREPARFEALAREYSNCPSSAEGGVLGQVARGDAVPEFEQAVFAGEAVGVLPDLVSTRFGFHVVLVERRIAGRVPSYDEARDKVASALGALAQERELGEYVRALRTPCRAT